MAAELLLLRQPPPPPLLGQEQRQQQLVGAAEEAEVARARALLSPAEAVRRSLRRPVVVEADSALELHAKVDRGERGGDSNSDLNLPHAAPCVA